MPPAPSQSRPAPVKRSGSSLLGAILAAALLGALWLVFAMHGSPAAGPALPEGTVAFRVEIAALLEEVRADSDAAAEKWEGLRIEVEGVLENHTGSPWVVDPRSGARIAVWPVQSELTWPLNGSPVRVQGVCAVGDDGNLHVARARFVRTGTGGVEDARQKLNK